MKSKSKQPTKQKTYDLKKIIMLPLAMLEIVENTEEINRHDVAMICANIYNYFQANYIHTNHRDNLSITIPLEALKIHEIDLGYLSQNLIYNNIFQYSLGTFAHNNISSSVVTFTINVERLYGKPQRFECNDNTYVPFWPEMNTLIKTEA